MKNESFFMRPLLWRPYFRQYSPEDTFWGLRMHFLVGGIILICWKAPAGMKFSRRNHPDLVKSSGRDAIWSVESS